MENRVRHSIALLSTCAAFAAVVLLLASTVQAAPHDWLGAYETTVKGDCKGKGVIAIGAKSLNINLHVETEAGEKGELKAKVELKDGRFTGKGTVMGVEMTISGRIEGSDTDGTVKEARIQATFVAVNGMSGRLVGVRRGK